MNYINLDVLYEIKIDGDCRCITLNNSNIDIVEWRKLSNPINFIGYDYNDKEKVRELIEKQIEEKLAKNSRK